MREAGHDNIDAAPRLVPVFSMSSSPDISSIVDRSIVALVTDTPPPYPETAVFPATVVRRSVVYGPTPKLYVAKRPPP